MRRSTITFAIIVLLPTIGARANLRLQPPTDAPPPPTEITPVPQTQPPPTPPVAAAVKPPVKRPIAHSKPISPPTAPETPAIAPAPPPSPDPPVTQVMSNPSIGQPASTICQITYGGFAAVAGDTPRANTITMKNDGGWCGHLSKSVRGSLVFGAPAHVVIQPSHGVVSVKQEDKGTAIYYRPTKGYVGSDRFSVINELFNIERPYNVIIQ